MTWYMYILRCADGSYYVDSTDAIERRLDEHQRGRGAKWTKSRTPVELVYLQQHESHQAALVQEREVKGWSRQKKEHLIERYSQSVNAERHELDQ